ncbi:phosphodiesterase [Cellulomonas humilata]|uniref:Phosphodiesterase n=1 Tax=Cellulomonas humilata TaxID=144055 RepID=A0A7Y6A2X7_9CELL|nr:phosphodiesterase [Cellulomonas humilata]
MPAAAPALHQDLHRAGYYPELVVDVLDVALADEEVVAHLVHPETTFDAAEVRRHVTVLVLTPTRLVVAHVDDHPADSEHPSASASATTEAVPLAELTSVALTHVVPLPEKHERGQPAQELTLVIGWGAVSRVDLEPATCGDPSCDADHGLTGTLAPDDVVVRVSAAAEGLDSVRAATAFARQLSAASARAR